MYLIIYENGTMKHREQLEDWMLRVANDGLVDVVDISNPEHPLRYFDEGWCSVDIVPAR